MNFYIGILGLILMGSFTSGEEVDETLRDANGTISSPLYPASYPANLKYTWRFEAPVGMVVELTFDVLDLEMDITGICIDEIEVFDGSITSSSASGATICEKDATYPRYPTRYHSSSSVLTMRMQTDDSISGRGFQASYKHVSPRLEYVAAIGVNVGPKDKDNTMDLPDNGVSTIVRVNRFWLASLPSVLLSECIQPSALTYDPFDDYFFYTDIEGKFIGRIHVYDEKSDILIRDGIENPLGIAAAYLTGLLYWTDAGRDEISVSRLDGLYRKTLVPANSGCVSPRGIALTPDHQYVYWSCRGKIERSKADGSGREIFLDDLDSVKSMFINPYDQKLYWMGTSWSSGIVEEINLDGSNRNTVLHDEMISEFHDLVVDKSLFFFSHPESGKIYHKTRNSSFSSIYYTQSLIKMKGLVLVSSDSAKTEKHQCAINNGGCPELCLPDGHTVTCHKVLPTEQVPTVITITTRTIKYHPTHTVIYIAIFVVLISLVLLLIVCVSCYCGCLTLRSLRRNEQSAAPLQVEPQMMTNLQSCRNEGLAHGPPCGYNPAVYHNIRLKR